MVRSVWKRNEYALAVRYRTMVERVICNNGKTRQCPTGSVFQIMLICGRNTRVSFLGAHLASIGGLLGL